MKRSDLVKTVAVLALISGVSAYAQAIASKAANVNLTATLPESITVELDQNAVAFALTPGSPTNAGNIGIKVTKAWNLLSGRTALKLYAYFDSAVAALSFGPNNIPSASISAMVGGTSVGPFTNMVPFGTGVILSNQPITSADLASSQTSAVTLNIDLSTLSNLPAGTYTGTLHFQAEATP